MALTPFETVLPLLIETVNCITNFGKKVNNSCIILDLWGNPWSLCLWIFKFINGKFSSVIPSVVLVIIRGILYDLRYINSTPVVQFPSVSFNNMTNLIPFSAACFTENFCILFLDSIQTGWLHRVRLPYCKCYRVFVDRITQTSPPGLKSNTHFGLQVLFSSLPRLCTILSRSSTCRYLRSGSLNENNPLHYLTVTS